MIIIDPGDLITLRPKLDVATASLMIQGAVARAAQIAPCILADELAQDAAARAIILDALVRRADTTGGVVTQQTAGPFSQSTDSRSASNLFTAQERADLAALCGGGSAARTIDTAPVVVATDPWFGALVNGPTGTAPGGL